MGFLLLAVEHSGERSELRRCVKVEVAIWFKFKFSVAVRLQRPYGLIIRDGEPQDGHLDFHTVRSSFSVALRPQRPY